MAKDRTRRARIREPKQESQADIVAQEAMQALAGFAYAAMMPAMLLVDTVEIAVDCVNRILEAEHGEPPFVGKSRFDARPDKCAKCPAQMRSSTQEEKNLYENMLARMSTPIDVDIFAYDDVTAHAAECARRCGSDDEGD